MVKITHLDDAFSEFFKLEASSVEGQSLQPKEKERRKKKGEKKNYFHFLIQKLSKFGFLRMPEQNVKRDACGKKGMLSCCKILFE